jgi:hypothetical protein
MRKIKHRFWQIVLLWGIFFQSLEKHRALAGAGKKKIAKNIQPVVGIPESCLTFATANRYDQLLLNSPRSGKKQG